MNVNRNYLKILIVLMALILAACGTAGTTEQPATTQAPAITAEIPATQKPTMGASPTAEAETGLRRIAIDAVTVEIGVGSPIPVVVVASGTWPDLCAQVAKVQQQLSGTSFEIEVLASPAQPDCPPDQVGLPFRIDIPLNMVEAPGGTYSVSVNGVTTAIAWDFSPASGGVLADQFADQLVPLSIAAVTVDVGVGSPIPVEVVASGDWPSLCSQLAEIHQQIDGDRIEIRLLATPEQAECPEDNVGLPFRVAVPLNMVEMPLGTYSVNVNGVQTQLEWTGRSPEPSATDQNMATAARLVYVGADGNLWLLSNASAVPQQITTDATPPDEGGAEVVRYYFPNLSPDGRFLAARREIGQEVASGASYRFELWVYDVQSGVSRSLLESETPVAGFDWKPGTHRLAYGLGTDLDYFMSRGEPDPELAKGIFEIDLDDPQAEASQLVTPERGYSLMLPVWSPDGRFLSFDEIWNIEGRGMFAYYDFDAGEYVSWEEAIGNYDWSPDGSQIVYDRMTYTATGEERIFVRPRTGGEEQQISPEMDLGYAFLPVFSHSGEQIAYFAHLGEPDTIVDTLYVQGFPDEDPRQLGEFESAFDLYWTTGDSGLVLNAGAYPDRQVIQVFVPEGNSNVIADGTQPDVATP